MYMDGRSIRMADPYGFQVHTDYGYIRRCDPCRLWTHTEVRSIRITDTCGLQVHADFKGIKTHGGELQFAVMSHPHGKMMTLGIAC